MAGPISSTTTSAPLRRTTAAPTTPLDAGSTLGSGPRDQLRLSGASATSPLDPSDVVRAAKEAQVLNGLSPDAQVKYLTLNPQQKEQLQQLFFALKPESQKALSCLLERGVLTQPARRGDADMLTRLERLTHPENLAPEVQNEQIAKDGCDRTGIQTLPFVDQLVQEAADPGKIAQRLHNTCGATTVEYMLAQKDPSEFVRLASEVASPSGKVTLAGGQTVDVHDSNGARLDKTMRSDVDRMMQSAFMDASRANPVSHYDNLTDKGGIGPIFPGLPPWNMPGLIKQVLGEDRDFIERISPMGQTDVHTMLDRIEATTQNGQPVPVLTEFKGPGEADGIAPLHYLAVTKVDRKHGTVTLRNPWGDWDQGSKADGEHAAHRPQRETSAGPAGTITMSIEEFERIVRAAFPAKA